MCSLVALIAAVATWQIGCSSVHWLCARGIGYSFVALVVVASLALGEGRNPSCANSFCFTFESSALGISTICWAEEASSPGRPDLRNCRGFGDFAFLD